MKKARYFLLALLFVVGCSKAASLHQELRNILYELMDNLVKINDDESARRFLDGDARRLDDRAKDFSKRLDEYVRNVDKVEKLDLLETLQSDFIMKEMGSTFKVMAQQTERIRALQTKLQAEGKKTENISRITDGYIKGFFPQVRVGEAPFAK